MRAVIDGVRYDTEKADRVASFSNGNDTNSFEYFEEELYVTTRGTWFVAGWGNARSRYASDVGNATRGTGERVTPLTSDEARAWLERHREVDALERYFADSLLDG